MFVASRPKTNCSQGPLCHGIVMFLVSLHVLAKFQVYVFVIIELFASHNVMQQMCAAGSRITFEYEKLVARHVH